MLIVFMKGQKGRALLYKSVNLFLFLLLLGQPQTHAQQARPPIQVTAKAAEVMQDGSSWWFQGDVEAVYGEQVLSAEEVKLFAVGENEWRLEAHTEVEIQDPGFNGNAKTLTVWLVQQEQAFAPTRISLTEFDVNTTGELGQLRYRAQRGSLRFERTLASVLLSGGAQVGMADFKLRADELSLTREEGGRWGVNAVGGVRFEGAEQTVSSQRLALSLLTKEGQTQLESATLTGFGGAGVFTNAVGERHDIRYEGGSAAFTFEAQQLTRMTLERARFTTCMCAETIEQASYSFSGRQVTLWPDEWIFGRDITLKASGVPLFWIPIFFAPLKEIEFEGSQFLPEIGRDAQRGWFARWRLPLFADPGNRGTFLFDYYHRFAETGLGVDWAYTLPLQTQSGRLHVYHLVGQHELLDVSWSHRWPISSLADLSWSLSRQDVTPPAAAPSRWAYNVNLNGQLNGWQWRLNGAREEASQGDQEQAPAFLVLERLPELSVSHSGRVLDWLQYGGSASWGRFREQRGAQAPFLERNRLDAGANLSLASLTVQSDSLRFGASGGARYSDYGQGQARTSVQLQVDAQWRPLHQVAASARYLFRSVQGDSPFAFDALQVADALTAQVQFSLAGVQGSLSGGYRFHEQLLDPLTLTLDATVGRHTLSGVARTRANAVALDAVQLQHTWQADWGRWSAQGGYSVSANRFEDLIVKLSLESFRLGARIDLNRGVVRRTNAEFDLRLGRWSLDFNGEYDWTLGHFSALQVGLVHHFCKDCWQAGVYLSEQRVWLQVQINAFPGVGLNYSPSDGALGFQ